jgi:hypothetical protein
MLTHLPMEHLNCNANTLPFAAQNCTEDGQMSRKTIFDYARAAAQAEQRIIEMMDSALREGLAEVDRSYVDLPRSAQPRQGHETSG